MQPCLTPGLEASEAACGGWLRLWDVHGGGGRRSDMWGAELLWGAACLLYLLFPEGPLLYSFFFPSSFSPERVEAILSGQQSLSLRGLKGDLSKARKQ